MTETTETIKRAEVGDIVLYTLSKNDCDTILQDRQSAGQGTKRGNVPRPGDVLPATIVKFWGDPKSPNASANLQVALDGNDTLWAPSRTRFHYQTHVAPDYVHTALDGVRMPQQEGHWDAR